MMTVGNFTHFISGTYAQAANTGIVLVGGVRPSTVFWQVAGTMEIGSGATGASFQGIALAATQITAITGSTINGRLLSQTAVALQDVNIMQPQDSANCGNSVTVTVTACEYSTISL
jgi:hypothetical protein